MIGADKLKLSLKEAIGFKQLKLEDLIHNYIGDFIREKQLFVLLEDVEKVENLFFIFKKKNNFIIQRTFHFEYEDTT